MTFLNTLPGAIVQGLIWGIMAIGVYITYKILDIADLTVDGSMVTGACVCAVLVVAGVNVWIAMLAAIVAGMLAGLLTGVFHTLMGIPAILAGILTQLILWSVNLKVLGKANIGVSARTYNVAVTQLFKGQAILVVLGICAVIIGVLYWFFGTEIGASLRATGCNLNMSRAQGINTNKNKILGLVISNGIVALSGAVLMQYQGAADINMGRGAIVIGLAAVIIGEALFGKAGHVRSVDDDAAAVNRPYARDGVQHGGLSSPVSADNGDEIAVIQRQRNAAQRDFFVYRAGVESLCNILQFKHFLSPPALFRRFSAFSLRVFLSNTVRRGISQQR